MWLSNYQQKKLVMHSPIKSVIDDSANIIEKKKKKKGL